MTRIKTYVNKLAWILLSLLTMGPLTPASAGRIYSTDFPTVENPLSEGGNWKNGKQETGDWSSFAVNSSHVAYGLQSGTNTIPFDDSIAVLTGPWANDQEISATVRVTAPNPGVSEELELQLRSTMRPHSITGYEISFNVRPRATNFVMIVRWNGPFNGGNFWTILKRNNGPEYGVEDGDVIRATAIGNVITVYKNGVQVIQVTDGTYPSGAPGIGAYLDFYSGPNQQFGFSSVTAKDVDPTPLPVPWQNQDIGVAGTVGSATHAKGTFTVKGSGSDIWDAADGFQYVYQPANGDCEIKARVATQQNTHAGAKAGVMIRETLNANSKHATMLVTPVNGLYFQCRSSPGGSTTSVSGGTGSAPYWVRMVRSGSTFTGYKSTDGASWTLVSSTNISMGTSVYVGLPVCSRLSTLGTVTYDNATTTP